MSEVVTMRKRKADGLEIAAGLVLPLEVVTEKLAFLGRTGSGKTYGAMKLAELMLGAGAQVGAIDPVGVWRALRVPADGGTSFDVVVFGGLYGDLPLEPTEAAGALIADLVCDRGLSFVLDVSQFIPSEQQRFVRAFADRFFHRKKSAPSAVHLFLEECQEFIPENPSGDEAKTLGVMQRLWKLGRNFGIGGSLISQRPQEIAKKALNMSGTLFAFQMTGPQERTAIKKWVADQGIATDIEGVLQRLAVGEPHVESPTFLEVSKTVRILPRVTADLSSTPKVGASTAAKRALTPIDVEQLREQLGATIEKVKADDPKELRKQIAEKDRELVQLRKAGNQTTAVPTKEVPVLTDRDRELLQRLFSYFEDTAGKLGVAEAEILLKVEEKVTDVVNGALSEWRQDIERARRAFAEEIEQPDFARVIEKLTSAAGPTPARPIVVASRPSVTAPRAQGVADPEQRILDSLAWWAAAGVTQPTRHQVAFGARYTVNGHFNNTLGGLRTKGLLDYPAGGRVALTAEGGRAANAPEIAATRADLIERAQEVLRDEPQRRLFSAAVKAVVPVTREQLASAAGYTVNGHFNNTLGALRSIGLLDYPGRGWVGLGEMFNI